MDVADISGVLLGCKDADTEIKKSNCRQYSGRDKGIFCHTETAIIYNREKTGKYIFLSIEPLFIVLKLMKFSQ